MWPQVGVALALTAWVGPGLPTYITFYPAVMVVALLAGFGPGLLATALTRLLVGYWILPPVGQFGIASPVDRLGLVIFTGMGLFMSVVAELYRRNRDKAAAYDRESGPARNPPGKGVPGQPARTRRAALRRGLPRRTSGLLNHAYEQLTGYTAAELRALDWSTTLTPPEWRELEKQKLDELHRTGQPVRYEKEYVRKDGSRVPIELLVHLVRDAEGKPEYYYSFLTDITERKRAEEALKLTQASVDGAAEMVAWFTSDGKVYYVNDATCRTLGYTREELMNMTALDFSPGFTQEQYEEHWREVRKRKSFTLQPLHRRKDGSTYTAEVLVNYVVYGGQEFIFAYGRDITERKQAEEALRRERIVLSPDTGVHSGHGLHHSARRLLRLPEPAMGGLHGRARWASIWVTAGISCCIPTIDRARLPPGRTPLRAVRPTTWSIVCGGMMGRTDGFGSWAGPSSTGRAGSCAGSGWQ